MDLYTIGHSTRTFEQLVALLQAHHITILVDIRTVPKSRHNPHFAQELLEKTLPPQGIGYIHISQLGGLRKADKESIHTAIEHKSFRGYADHMMTDEFEEGVTQLLHLAKRFNIAFMCAEGNPFRCHRKMLADLLTARGHHVWHVTSKKSAKEHLVSDLVRLEDDKLIYDVIPM